MCFCVSKAGKVGVELCLVGMQLGIVGGEACVGVGSGCCGSVMGGVSVNGGGGRGGRGARGSTNETGRDVQCDAVCDVALSRLPGLVVYMRWVYVVVVLSVPCECYYA